MRKQKNCFDYGRLALPQCVEEAANSQYRRFISVVPVPEAREMTREMLMEQTGWIGACAWARRAGAVGCEGGRQGDREITGLHGTRCHGP